jgi:hypothetical protein
LKIILNLKKHHSKLNAHTMRISITIFALLVLFCSCEKEYVYQVGNLPFFEFNKVALNGSESLDTSRSFFNGTINGVSTAYVDGESTIVSGGNLEITSQKDNQRYRFVYKLTPTVPQSYHEFPEIYLPSFMTNNIRNYVDSLVVGKAFELSTPFNSIQPSNSVALVMKVPYSVKSKSGSQSEIQVFYSYPEKQEANAGVKIISKEFKKMGTGKSAVDLVLSVNCVLEDYQLNSLEIQDGLFKIRIYL